MGIFRGLERSLRHALTSGPARRRSLSAKLARLEEALALVKRLAAEPLVQRARSLPPGTPLADTEFRVSSMFGEDGILQHLTAHVPCPARTFIEFGVEDFREANCRFLAERDPWAGLVMDGDPELERRREPIHTLRDITARSVFVTAENVNQLFQEAGFRGDVGILSIDIDGNDYWVWKAVDCVSPRIVVIEYNSVFGPERSVTVPYDATFNRREAHYSWLYAGASLPALVDLGREKGYAFIGSNSAGNNAFFVRRDVLGSLRELDAREGYVLSTFRESRDERGDLTYLAGSERLEPMRRMPLIDVSSGERIEVGELIQPPD